MIVLRSTWKKAITVSVAVVALSVGTVGEAIALSLKGAGASFPAPLYKRYFEEFKKETGIDVSYNPVGSGAGIDQFISDSVDFAGSDAPPSQSQVDQMPKGMVRVPTAGGAVAVVYNLPGVSQLKLSRTALADIFLGKITKWNDRAIAKDNPGVSLPDLPIKPVVREDSSGTTYIFTRHLSAINPQFQKQVDVGTAPNWPANPLKGPQNAGVANQVKQTEGAIGYVQDTFARNNSLPTAELENMAGQFVQPSLEQTQNALKSVRFYQDFRAANLKDPEVGYPIVGITWILVKQQYSNTEAADGVKKMVTWVMNKGQGLNETLEYTRIPEQVSASVVEAVNQKVIANQ